MDNIITGAIAVIIFLLFTGGLAQSIGAPPFIIIVSVVGIMLLVDFYQSAKQGLQKDNDSTPPG
ncbi:MAG TPA: hypothetical protein VKB27_14170 [Gammaproteobacteria bacterium]|nr:hypothetical protein [Gammaproteobacteria bacterium]